MEILHYKWLLAIEDFTFTLLLLLLVVVAQWQVKNDENYFRESTTDLRLPQIHSTCHNQNSEGKVLYGQEPQSGESTNTECGVNYQLLAVIY